MKRGSLIYVYGPEYFPFKHLYEITKVEKRGEYTYYTLRLAEYHGRHRAHLRERNHVFHLRIVPRPIEVLMPVEVC